MASERQRPPSSEGFTARMRSYVRGRTVLAILVVGVLLYLVLGPLLMLLLSSVQATHNTLPLSPGAVWSLSNYNAVFGNPQTWQLFGRTLLFGAGSLLVAFSISIPCAWLIERTNLPLRNAMFVLVVAPTGIPTLVLAISWSLLLNPVNGILNIPLQQYLGFTLNVYSMPGMMIVQGLNSVPLTFLLILASLRGLNAALEDAASVSGASFSATLRRVTLPLLTPALLGAVVYLFVNMVETVDVPLVLGLPADIRVLSTQIFVSVNPGTGLPNYGMASTYGVLLLVLSVGPLIIYNRLIGVSGSFATVGGRGYRPKRGDLGRWRIPVLIALLGYIFVALGLPLLVLLWSSFQPFYAGINAAALERITFEGYDILRAPSALEAIQNTFVIAVTSAAAAMVVSLFVAWLIVRSRSRSIWLLDLLAFMPHAIPGVVIALAVLLIYLYLPAHVYGTVWIIVIAMATQRVSIGTRLTTSRMAQVQESLEEAGATSGATTLQVWRRVLVPLLRPAFVNGFLLIFLGVMQNFTLAVMLLAPGNVMLSTLIWGYWEHGDVNATAVLCVCLTAITLVAATILRSVTGSGSRA